jgi:hypothetical protein
MFANNRANAFNCSEGVHVIATRCFMTHHNKPTDSASSSHSWVLSTPFSNKWLHCIISIVWKSSIASKKCWRLQLWCYVQTLKTIIRIIVMHGFVLCICTRSCLGYCLRTTNGPNGVYTYVYSVGDDPVTYFWYFFGQRFAFSRPPGTAFSFPLCQCVMCSPGGPCGMLDFDPRMVHLYVQIYSSERRRPAMTTQHQLTWNHILLK